ncbi:MAG: DUF4240 domain-containing protein [Planctomycetaceae bacterium]|nr:DUF4240 domain-containing protein [Planctomycetaceae bacterium]
MTPDEFWSLIDSTRGDVDDPWGHAEAVESELEQKSPEDIMDFERHLSALMEKSYNWDLWGAAYLINGGCSDDGFDYFRGWLVLQGKKVFEQALKDPDSLADYSGTEMEVECEEILSAAFNAYQTSAGKDFPGVPINCPDLGEDWDFDDDDEMSSRYPKLFARFCEE